MRSALVLELMNLIIVTEEDFVAQGRVSLAGRRLEHILQVHRASAGDSLRVGMLGGKIGTGTIDSISADALVMDVTLDRDPPPPLPLRLVLAIPRPKVFNRVVAAITSLGIKKLYLINAWRVEKSYWKSPRLSDANVRRQLVTGLEQAGDTILPDVQYYRFFREFVEKNLDAVSSGSTRIVAHPGGREARPAPGAITAMIGPEGGFIESEISLLREHGFETVSLGTRILRVETAVPFLAGRIAVPGA